MATPMILPGEKTWWMDVGRDLGQHYGEYIVKPAITFKGLNQTFNSTHYLLQPDAADVATEVEAANAAISRRAQDTLPDKVERQLKKGQCLKYADFSKSSWALRAVSRM